MIFTCMSEQESKQVVLGQRLTMEGSGLRRRFVTKKECMVYIPILKTLEVLLNNDTVLSEVGNAHAVTSRYLYNDTHGFVCYADFRWP